MRLKKRDLSWLRFNERVLQEAMDPSVPLYERIKFLAIFSSNLDEFFSVRVSALRQFSRIRKSERKKIYDIKPNRALKTIYAEVRKQQTQFGKIINEEIIPELHEHGIHLVGREEFDSDQIAHCLDYFANLPPADVKITWIKDKTDIPFLENNTIYLVLRTEHDRIGIANVPINSLGRFIKLPSTEEETYYTFLEDIVAVAIHTRIPEAVTEIISIKLSRDAETYIEDEFSGDLIVKIKQAIEERGEGMPTRLLYDKHISDHLLLKLRDLFSLGKSDMIEGGRYHNFKDFFQFPEPVDMEGLVYDNMDPLPHPNLQFADSLLTHAQDKDEIIHFPYQSFDYIPLLLREAADSEEVAHLNMTLYRISKTSEVAQALMYALEQGKKVTVFIEVKARFDEENNLAWGERLEAAGAKVIYSYPGIKIHSKIILIKMHQESELSDVGYVGTGNFNEKTSRIYCDHGLLTTTKKITKELNQIFLVLQGSLIVPKAKYLLVSPFTTRQRFEELIEFEIEQKKAGKKAWIHIKMNSLEDPKMIEKLYKASNAGVEVRLIIRGFCCLIPGIKGMSENIYVTSIIDRFLEHARIYHFAHAGEEQMFIGSADWMTRNLDRRIEVCTPIFDERVKKELADIFSIQFQDNIKARIIDEEETNQFVVGESHEPLVRAQFQTYDYLKTKLEQASLN